MSEKVLPSGLVVPDFETQSIEVGAPDETESDTDTLDADLLSLMQRTEEAAHYIRELHGHEAGSNGGAYVEFDIASLDEAAEILIVWVSQGNLLTLEAKKKATNTSAEQLTKHITLPLTLSGVPLSETAMVCTPEENPESFGRKPQLVRHSERVVLPSGIEVHATARYGWTRRNHERIIEMPLGINPITEGQAVLDLIAKAPIRQERSVLNL